MILKRDYRQTSPEYVSAVQDSVVTIAKRIVQMLVAVAPLMMTAHKELRVTHLPITVRNSVSINIET